MVSVVESRYCLLSIKLISSWRIDSSLSVASHKPIVLSSAEWIVCEVFKFLDFDRKNDRLKKLKKNI
jgi:hypothetical protein